MIKIHTYYADDMGMWWQFFNRLPPQSQSVYHRPDYLLFQQNVFGGKAVCQVFEGDACFVYFPALLRELPFGFGGYDLTSSWYYGGPISSWRTGEPFADDLSKAIIEGRNALNAICEFIRCDPNQKNHVLLTSPFLVHFDRPTIVVDLTKSWAEIESGFSSQNNRNVTKARKSGLTVDVDQSQRAWASFAQIYQDEMVRKNGPSHLRFGEVFFEELPKDNGFTLFTIKSNEQVIGGFVAAHGASIAHHFLSAVQYDQWEKRPNNLLFSEVLHHFWKEGYRIFDFQGGREGVFQFKKNFSKLREEFFVARCIYDQRRFNDLVERFGQGNSLYFPPYRRPQ